MTVSRPGFPSPVIVIEGFLADADADRGFQECLDLEPAFRPASVEGLSGAKVDPGSRRHHALDLETGSGADRSRSAMVTAIERRLHDEECRRLWHQGGLIFDIINYCTCRQATLSRYGRGDFFRRHRDTLRNLDRPADAARRLVTLVYYLSRRPARFSGGALTLHEHGEQLAIEPAHNRAVVFPSFTLHDVAPVQVADDRWESGRFSLNYWMGFG